MMQENKTAYMKKVLDDLYRYIDGDVPNKDGVRHITPKGLISNTNGNMSLKRVYSDLLEGMQGMLDIYKSQITKEKSELMSMYLANSEAHFPKLDKYREQVEIFDNWALIANEALAVLECFEKMPRTSTPSVTRIVINAPSENTGFARMVKMEPEEVFEAEWYPKCVLGNQMYKMFEYVDQVMCGANKIRQQNEIDKQQALANGEEYYAIIEDEIRWGQ